MSSDGALFRVEAIEAARSRYGSPVNNFGVKSWVLVGFVATVFVSALTFIATAHYAKKETVLGVVTPSLGVARIAPMRAGLIKKVWVKSGEVVRTDQALFTLSYDQVLENGETLSNQLSQNAQTQIASNQAEGSARKDQIIQSQIEITAKLTGLAQDFEQSQQQYALQIERIALLQQSVEAARTLIAKQYISAVQLRGREDALIQARQSLLQIEQSLAQNKSLSAQLTAQLASTRLSLTQAHANTALSTAQLREHGLSNQSATGAQVLALTDGQVTNIQARIGDMVAANQTLGLIVPNGAKSVQQVTLWVPSRAVGFVERGSKVRLMYDAFPYQTFGIGRGRVVEISTAPIMPNELPVPIETKEQMYKITVALERDRLTAYGRDWAILPGMRVMPRLLGRSGAGREIASVLATRSPHRR